MKKKRVLLISIICFLLIAAMSIPMVAWLAAILNSVDTDIDTGYVIQQYFHCGTGTEEDPFVITRPIHYYHLVELYLRYPTSFANLINTASDKNKPIYFQLGYDFAGNGTRQVYAYDEFGNTNGSYSNTLNMLYYSGDLSLVPIGTSSHPFNGVFDGSGLTIENLSIRSSESIVVYENDQRTVVQTGSGDIGIFGYVNNTDGKAVIKNAYFENVTISLEGASCAYGQITGVTNIHSEGNVCIGTVIGHLYSYTNAQNRDYYQDTVGTAASPISNVYVNDVTVTGGTATGTTAICDYGLIGYVENTDGEQAQTIRQYFESSDYYGDGNEGWGGSMNMTELFNRVTALITGRESSSNRYYPLSETIIKTASASGSPKVTITSASSNTLKSSYGSVYYWSASGVAGLNNAADMTGGSIFGTDSGNEWNYLYGLSGSQLTTTTSYTKTGSIVTAYYLYDNGAYLSFDGTNVISKKSTKDAIKLIPYDETTNNGITTAKYYILVDNEQYYLRTVGQTGIAFDKNASTASTWLRNGSGEFYTMMHDSSSQTDKAYYLSFSGSWTLSGSSQRYSISDGTHYLSATTDGVVDETVQNESYIWVATQDNSKYYFYFISSDTRYYLHVKNGELAICQQETGADYGWTVNETNASSGMKLSTTINGITYYLCYDNGWKATINGYTISYSTQYLKATLVNGESVISTVSQSSATVFQLQRDDNGTKIVVPINGTAYYLSNIGEELTLSSTAVYWTRTSNDEFYRNVSYTGNASALSNNYCICYDNGWKVCPESGYYFAATVSGTTNYMTIQNGAVANTTNASNATIWQFNTTDSYYILTLIGKDYYYLALNENGLYITNESSYGWNKQGSSFYRYVGTYYGSEDRIHLGFLENGTWGTYINQYVSGDNTENSWTICDTTQTHYLTYNIRYKTTASGVTNYLVVDGNRSSACTWIIKATGTVIDSKPEVVIYTYIGTNRYFLNVIDGTLCASSTVTTWSKTTNLGGSGNDGFSKNGYYLSFESPNWTLIDLTASIKLNYIDSNSASHYLYTNGTGLGVATDSSLANNFNYSSVTNQLSTTIGTAKYYLTYEVATIKEKSNDESSTVINAYRKIVPAISTSQPSVSWGVDNGHYYLTINDVRFYLYFDEESYSWQFEEIGGYQIKEGSNYLTLLETPDNLLVEPISFNVSQLYRSTTPNYQWHLINGQLFTFIGDVPYYITYTTSNAKAQMVSLTTTKPTGTLFAINGTTLYNTISNVEFSLSYINNGVTLPNGYTMIDYLESGSYTCIDTGVADGQDITIDCDVEVPSNSGNQQYLFGSTQNGGWMYNGLYYNANSTISLDFAFKYSPTTSASRVQMTQSLSNGTVTVTFNGTTMGSYSVGSTAPTGNIFLYGCNGGSRLFGSSMKIYHFTIKRDNVAIRDFIPVINSNGIAGLYDIIEGKFYSNEPLIGSSAGNTELSQSTIQSIKSNGFTALEYIQSTGKQIINTGVADGQNITIDCDVEVPSKSGNEQYLFGSTQNGNWMYNGLYYKADNKISLDFAFKYSPTTSASRVQMTQSLSNGNVTVTFNGTTMGSYSVESTSPTGKIYIFGCNGGTRYFGAGMKVYRFTIKKDGDTIRDFIPAKRDSDGVCGLYDLVEEKFYVNENDTINDFSTGSSSFYMIPANSYSSIASGNTYMTLATSNSIGVATKNSSNLYEYHHFQITGNNSDGYTIRLGNTGYYLTTKGTGSSFVEKGALTTTTTASSAKWYMDGNKYYRIIDSTNYYLVYTSSDGWFTSPSKVTLSFRYILSNENYMVVNNSKNGITSTTTYSTTNEYLRWFVEGNKLYAEISNSKYYLTWSASAGFGITTSSSSATAFTITTIDSSANTASIAINGSSPTLYVIHDASGWNISINGGNYIYSGSSYINATSLSSVSIESSGKSRWYNNSGMIYTYYAGKIAYWTTANGSSLTLTTSSSSATTWTISSGKYSTVYNGTTYSLYLNASTLSMTGPKGYFVYAIILPTYNNGPDHSYMYHPSNTDTSPKNTNTSTMTEALGGLWTYSNNLIYFTYTSGSKTKTNYLTYTSSSSPVSSGSGTSFNIGENTSDVTWSYNATTHRLIMTKGTITGYVCLRIASNSIQGWKLYSNDTTESITKSDNKTTGNYFDVYMDPVYDESKVTTFSSSSQTSIDAVLKSATYITGMDPQNITREQSTESPFIFGNSITAVSPTAPIGETQEARTTTNLKTYTYISGQREVWSSQTFTKQKLTITSYTSTPVFVYITYTNANPTVTILQDTDQLYTSTQTTYKRGTYLPIKAEFTDDAGTVYTDDYRASQRNTGYIVGGAYSSKSGSGQGDIRVSEYSSGNISSSYNRSYGTFSNIYTFNDSGTSPVRINDSANSYINYEYTKEKFAEILSQNRSYVYGLHFMNSAISTAHTMYAEAVRIMGKTYINYELPESSIDFNVYERGYIVLYAGDYYNGNNCFFSLHKIFRNADQSIEKILEVSEIYAKTDVNNTNYYIYKFTDGTYTDNRGVYQNSQLTTSILTNNGYSTTPVFKMKWLTNPTNGKSFSNDYIYYFEIPCNAGEYCLGSVTAPSGSSTTYDGGYLLYLDIASDGVRGTTYNQIAKISSDPLLTQMGYRYSNEPITINSLLNIGYKVPTGNNASNFSISVSYSHFDVIHDEEYNTDCTVYTINITNTTGNLMDLFVLLLDDDDDPSNDYCYRYRIIYNGQAYVDSSAYDPSTEVFYATSSFTLPPSS